ncbi:MAG TPA: hypothetical protein VF256_07540 [Streptosporangiaceae bacterium]
MGEAEQVDRLDVGSDRARPLGAGQQRGRRRPQVVAACVPFFLAETPRQPGHFDLAGALTSVTGMAALVYAFIRAAAVMWSDPATLAALALAGVGLTAFVLTEARATQPVTPLRLFADGQRSASHASRLLLVGGMFGMFYFATQFLQVVLGFSPVRAGLAFLPLTILIFGVSRLAARGAALSGLASGHEVLVHGMASAFAVATLFDVGALLVMATAAVVGRRARRGRELPLPGQAAR